MSDWDDEARERIASAAALDAYRRASNAFAEYMGDPDGNEPIDTADNAAALVIEDYARALTLSPPSDDVLRVAPASLIAFFKAWDDYVVANDRTNAAIPAVSSTPAERAVYDERYRASEEARRDWWRAAETLAHDDDARKALNAEKL